MQLSLIQGFTRYFVNRQTCTHRHRQKHYSPPLPSCVRFTVCNNATKVSELPSLSSVNKSCTFFLSYYIINSVGAQHKSIKIHQRRLLFGLKNTSDLFPPVIYLLYVFGTVPLPATHWKTFCATWNEKKKKRNKGSEL